MPTIADLRAAVGAGSNRMSDEELLAAYAKGANMSPNQAAMEFGWNPSTNGMWGNRLGSAVDSYQANLYGLGEAVGSDWARRKRIENEFAADVSRDRAAAQGAISSFKDVGGVGDFFNYAGGLAVQSAPYMAEMLAGGLAARGLSTGLRAAANAGRAAGATEEAVTAGRAASEQLARRAEMTGLAASYPSSVSDILSNQREQTGTMDLPSALLLGVPYALANKFGIEGALARGTTMKSGIQALDNMTGLRGAAARTAASAGKGVLQEAPSETFQEGMNQFGRMAVDPNETFFNERSNERFMESAVGGGVLGGLFGGGMGGWRRSDQFYADREARARQEAAAAQAKALADAQTAQRQEQLNLLAPEVPKAGEQLSLFGSPYMGAESETSVPAPRPLQELLAERDRIRAETLDVLRQKNHAEHWFHGGQEGELQNPAAPNEPNQRWEEMASQLNRRLFELKAQDAAISTQLEPYQRDMAFADQGRQLGLDFTKPILPQQGPLQLGWNQRMESPLLVLPNGQAVAPEQFALFSPPVQQYLLSQGVFSPTSGFAAASAASQPAGPFTPQRVDMLLGLPTPTTDKQRAERQKQLEATLNEPSGVMVQDAKTGVERELSMSEFQALQAGQLRLPVGFNIYLPQAGQGAPALPGVINVNPFGQAGATDTQNQTLLADTTDPGTELARQRILQGFVGAPATAQDRGAKDKNAKAAPAAVAAATPVGAAVASPVDAAGATSQKQEATWPNRPLWTQYGLPAKSTESARGVFDQAVQAKANGTLDAEGFERVVEGLRKHTNTGRSVLAAETSRVKGEKEQASKPSMAPKAPKQPAVVVPAPAAPSAPATGENQLLVQGGPNGSVPAVPGQRVGGSSDAGRTNAGGSVAATGSVPAATVGSSVPAAGVQADPGQAGASATATTQGQSAAVAAEEDADTRETRELWDEWASKEGAPSFNSLRPHVRDFLVRQPDMGNKTKQAALSMNASAAVAEQDEKQQQQAKERETKAAESDFDLNSVLSAVQSLPAKMQVAVRAFMGVDEQGDLAPDFEPMNARDAARKAGYAEKSSANVTRTLQKLGVTELGVRRLHSKAGQVTIVDEAEVLAGQGDTNAYADTDRAGLFRDSPLYKALNPSEDSSTPFADAPVEALAAAVANSSRFKTDPDQETSPRSKNIARNNAALIQALYAEAASRSRGSQAERLVALVKQETAKVNAERRRNERDAEQSDSGNDKFGTAPQAKGPTYTKDELEAEVKAFVRVDALGRSINIVNNVDELLNSSLDDIRAIGEALRDPSKYGIYSNNRVWIIADRIQKGDGRAAFMHEVGVHLGLERLLPDATFNTLVDKIIQWADKNDGSQESNIARSAVARVPQTTPDEDVKSEVLAYFVEEAMKAGIDPTANVQRGNAELRSWFMRLWAAFKTALLRLGFKPEAFTAQDVVNLAFGAARLEANGTWHGTAAEFKNFLNSKIGTGEGAQAYGWGTYLAQRFGVSKGYFEADIDRKTTKGKVTYQGKTSRQWMDSAPPLDSSSTEVSNEEKTALAVDMIDARYRNGRGGYASAQSAREDLIREFEHDIKGLKAIIARAKAIGGMALVAQQTATNASLRRGEHNLAALKALDPGQLQHKPGNSPEGSMMRVDTFVKPDELMVWEKPVNQQSPKVREVLKKVPNGPGWLPVAKTLDTVSVGHLYAALAQKMGDFELKVVSSGPRAGDLLWTVRPPAERVAKSFSLMIDGHIADFVGNPQAASEWLDSMGIKGVTHTDAPSRTKNKVFQAYKNQADLQALFDSIPADVRAKANLRSVLDLAQDIEDFANEGKDIGRITRALGLTKEAAGAVYRYAGWVQDKTSNIIVFNDKNVHRVATLTAADRQRTKFGSNAAGSYEATRARFDALNKALPPRTRTALGDIATVIKTAMGSVANRVVFTHDLIDRAKRVGLVSAERFGELYKKRAEMTNGLSGRVDNVARLYSEVPDAERGRGQGTVNDFIKDSTRTEVWGFVPDWLPEAKRANVKVDPAMAKRFNALSPQSQAFAKAVFEHGYKTLDLKKRTILGVANSEYKALIKAARDAGDEDEVARLESDQKKAQTKFESLFKTMGENPYAPLKRFGNWVVIAESKALKQARADNDAKRVQELEQNGRHYYVDFFESQMEALAAERELRAAGSYDDGSEGVVVRSKEEARERLYGGDGMAAAFTKLRNQARMRLEGEQDVSKRALLEMATDMYLSALAETSARKSEMRRRGIEGNIDIVRSFVTQGYADSHMVSALAFSGDQGDAINAMRRDKDSGSSAEQTRKSAAFNEIVKRHADSMEYREPNLFDNIKTAASLYYLAFSPAYYLQNLTQPWMVSLPTIAGRHDWGRTASAIGKAGGELKDAWLGAGVSQAIDLSKVPADVREAMQTLYDRGILTSGMNLESRRIQAAGATGVYGRTKQALGDVREFIDNMQTKVEVMNRTATAMAAYRLELANGASAEQALEYADQVVRQTHGDYSMMAAPRFFNNNFGKLALQFRKYQLLQLSLMARLIRESFTGTDRAAAAKALGFVLGQTGLLAGAMGLPGFTAIAWVLSKLFGDPDEPDDPEYKLRKAIGDKDTADLILKGLPARFGVDLSNKIGWQNALSLLPYTDIDLTKKSVTEIGMALTTGPAGAMAGKMVDGLAAMKDGRYIEGLTKTLPTGFGNAVKGADTFLNGVRNKDGEVLLSQDEINMAEAILMGTGITPTTMSAQSFRQRANYEATTNFAERASKIKRQFVDATREGSSRQEVIDAWKKLQDTRVENGFKRQPMQDLYDAVKESRKQERDTLNGVQFRTTNRPFVERLGQM